MKILYTCMLAIISLPCLSQTVVKKPVTIVQIRGGQWIIKLDRVLIDGDTTYYFVFRDRQYKELVEVKSITLNKAGLTEFNSGLSRAQTVAPGDDVLMSRYTITKQKVGLGTIGYSIWYQHGYCELSGKDMGKLIVAMEEEIK